MVDPIERTRYTTNEPRLAPLHPSLHCVKSPDQRHYKLPLSLKKVPTISFGGRKKKRYIK
jgi:hypothetical protein